MDPIGDAMALARPRRLGRLSRTWYAPSACGARDRAPHAHAVKVDRSRVKYRLVLNSMPAGYRPVGIAVPDGAVQPLDGSEHTC